MTKHFFGLKSIALTSLMLALFSCPVHAAPKTVKLSWGAPASQTGITITGYNIYRGTTAGGEGVSVYANVANGAVLTFTDAAVTPGINYFYKVKATATCDSSVWDCSAFVTESAASNEAASGSIPLSAAPVIGAPTAATAVVQ